MPNGNGALITFGDADKNTVKDVSTVWTDVQNHWDWHLLNFWIPLARKKMSDAMLGSVYPVEFFIQGDAPSPPVVDATSHGESISIFLSIF